MGMIPGIEKVNWMAYTGNAMYWIQWIVFGILIFGFMFVAYFIIAYNIKGTIIYLNGSGKEGYFSIGKKTWNRYRWNKTRTAWYPMLPLMNRKEVEPFPTDMIYSGNRFFGFDLNGIMIPGRIIANISEEDTKGKPIEEETRIKIQKEFFKYLKKTRKFNIIPSKIEILKNDEVLQTKIVPVPHHIRNWQSLTHKKHAQEYAQHTWWDDNKIMVFALIFAIAILAAGLIFIWLSYKMAGAGRTDIRQLTNALNNWGQVPGTPPQ